jgi:hypothetical protein
MTAIKPGVMDLATWAGDGVTTLEELILALEGVLSVPRLMGGERYPSRAH